MEGIGVAKDDHGSAGEKEGQARKSQSNKGLREKKCRKTRRLKTQLFVWLGAIGEGPKKGGAGVSFQCSFHRLEVTRSRKSGDCAEV